MTIKLNCIRGGGLWGWPTCLFICCISVSLPLTGALQSVIPSSTFHHRTRHSSRTLFAVSTPINGDAVIDSAIEKPEQSNLEDDDPFTLLSTLAATTLLQSDRRRDAIGKDVGAQASSATNWIDEGSSFAFRSALDKLKIYLPGDTEEATTQANGRERQDEAITWLRWLRSIPRPIIVDLSTEARSAANTTVSDDFLRLLNLNTDDNGNSTTETKQKFGLNKMQKLRSDFLNRLQCQLILIPSGQSMNGGLFEPAGSLTFGKLLYGGVTRYRVLPSSTSGSSNDATQSKKPPRRAGERTERKVTKYEHVQSWVQYGGVQRKYDAIDMGPAMVLEWSLLPKIQGGGGGSDAATQMKLKGDMMLQRLAWSPQNMFRYVTDDSNKQSTTQANSEANDVESASLNFNTPSSLHGRERNDAFASDFRSRVGGLDSQIDAIVRRVLDGRVIRPAEVDNSGNLLSYKEAKESIGLEEDDARLNGHNDDGLSLDNTSKQLSMAALEAEELALLGLTPVRGLLLYGPPGCGKTALAREIARALRARAPKIVAAPELLDRWVGGSERLVRELFQDAEAELASVNGDASRSALHVVVVDEIDAVFRKRTSGEDSGEATRSSTVNQILSKLDGVKAEPNVLLIGMTNRRELLDDALLRPGRLEVQIEVPLPNRDGRREILNIHFNALRNRGRLSRPLCHAIDGTYSDDNSGEARTTHVVDNPNRGRKRRAIKQATNNIIDILSPTGKRVYDLADDSITGGFSGADLEGLVRCAGSVALSRARKEGAGVEALLITLDDVRQALTEVKV